MNLAPLAGAGLVVAMGLWLLARLAHRRPGAAPIILAGLPLAVLMLVTPIPLVALWTIDAFSALAETGTTTQSDAATLARGMARPLWWGAVGFLASLCAGAALQRVDTQRVEALMAGSPAEPLVGRWWASAILSTSALLVLPAVFLFFRQAELVTFILAAGHGPSSPGAASIAGLSLEEFTRMMSRRLIVGTLGGFALLAMVVMSAVVNIAAFRFSAASEALLMFSRALLIFAGLFGVWAVYVLW